MIVIITILGYLSTPLPLKAQQTIPNHITYSQYNVTKHLITSKILQSRLNKSASILEMTSGYPEVKNIPYINSMNPILHGIPKNLDVGKRDVAGNILNRDKDFNAIFFALPNGDVYLVEPYSKQQNLTVNNLSFRDYFKGALATHNIYLGHVILSLSSGQRIADMVVPIYSKKNVLLGGRNRPDRKLS